MSAEQAELDSAALRAFAQLVLQNRVESDELENYVSELLERLVELPGICRREARLLSRRHIGLGARELAHLLIHRANQIDETMGKETL